MFFALHTGRMRRSVTDFFDGTRRTCEPGAVKKICHRTLILPVCTQRYYTTKRLIRYIYFTSFHSSRENELNKLTSLPIYGFIAQLVEHRTGIAEVTGSNPVEALIFFRLLLSNCLNWKIYCDDHSSL